MPNIRLRSLASLGSLLIEEPDSASMAAACLRYQMEQQPSENGYAVFNAQDGTIIRFKFESKDGHRLPVIDVQTPEKPDEIKKMLSQTGYTLTKEGYIKGSKFANKYTLCLYDNHKNAHLVFRKIINR